MAFGNYKQDLAYILNNTYDFQKNKLKGKSCLFLGSSKKSSVYASLGYEGSPSIKFSPGIAENITDYLPYPFNTELSQGFKSKLAGLQFNYVLGEGDDYLKAELTLWPVNIAEKLGIIKDKIPVFLSSSIDSNGEVDARVGGAIDFGNGFSARGIIIYDGDVELYFTGSKKWGSNQK